jgi:hypothetical protein
VSDVLVVQPDSAQADILRDIFRRVAAELVLVQSTREAMDAIAYRVPDLILLSTLLSSRDEDALMAHLRTLQGAQHLQTLTIPQFRSAADEAVEKKSAFSFRKKKKAKGQAPAGCDPTVFAEEIVAHLHRATEIRNRPVAAKPEPVLIPPPVEREVIAPVVMAPVAELAAVDDLAIDDPVINEPLINEPFIDEPFIDQPIAADVPVSDEPAVPLYVAPMSVLIPTEPEVATSGHGISLSTESVSTEDDIDRLARQLGLDVRLFDIAVTAPPVEIVHEAEDAFDFGAALDRARIEADERRTNDLARAQIDAEAIREAAVAEARATAEREAREAVAADMARIQAEAEVMRETAIAEARAVAEREAREMLAADMARVQAEAEAMRDTAIAEARMAATREARETLDVELARVRSETEVTVAEALTRVKLEAEEAERVRAEAEELRREAQEAFTAELARVRADVERSLATQLDAARAEAESMRNAEAHASRERVAAEAQLKSEIERLRFVAAQARKADESETRKTAEQITQLERELADVRAKSEQRQHAEVEELRAQMAEMRESAAQHARAAAAEAVASDVARAVAESNSASHRRPNVIRMQPRVPAPEPAPFVMADLITPEPVAAIEASEVPGDYYSLWTAAPPVEEVAPAEVDEEEQPRIDFRRHAKWALPVAACLLLVTNTGTAISTVSRLVTPAEKPALTVEPVNIEPFIKIVEKRVGSLQVESTPQGAEVIVGGRKYGKTPVTIPDLEVGAHTLVIKSTAGTITRKVTVKANETAVVTEAIFSGWLAIFSPIPIKVVVDGKAVTLTEDGRLMTAPGKHVVELISERFNYRATETLEVRPGETTAHTLAVPMGSVRVTAPEGAEILIDGQPPVGVPGEGLSIAVGSHEISATHPQFGVRRMAVDVSHGAVTEVALQF